jgi:hypothetical protein
MPKRRTPPRRTNNQIIEDLREAIAAGIPWTIPTNPPTRGYADLIFLVEGLYYPICDFIHSTDDIENIIAIWSEIREDCLREHIARRPGSRPAAWWRFEDREPRRVVEIDEKMRACNDGKILESEEEYLERHGLLRKKERAALQEGEPSEAN